MGNRSTSVNLAGQVLTEGNIDRVLSILDKYQARAFAEQKAHEYSQQAMHCLERAGNPTPAHQAIIAYALSLLERSS